MSSVNEIRANANQILRQASELQNANMFGPPKKKTNSSEHSSVKLDELIESARHIYERMVQLHPEEAGNWIRYAHFEMKNGDVARARNVFERAVKKQETRLPIQSSLALKEDAGVAKCMPSEKTL
ncbi:hypothetical protein ACFX2F_043006 [Malus domestica]